MGGAVSSCHPPAVSEYINGTKVVVNISPTARQLVVPATQETDQRFTTPTAEGGNDASVAVHTPPDKVSRRPACCESVFTYQPTAAQAPSDPQDTETNPEDSPALGAGGKGATDAVHEAPVEVSISGYLSFPALACPTATQNDVEEHEVLSKVPEVAT